MDTDVSRDGSESVDKGELRLSYDFQACISTEPEARNIHVGWFLYFKDPDIESEYVEFMDSQRNRRLLVKSWIAGTIILVFTFLGGSYYNRFTHETATKRVTSLMWVLMFVTCQTLIIVPRFNIILNETLGMCIGCVLALLRFFSGRYRLARILNKMEELGDSEFCDSDSLLLMVLIVTVLHIYFDLRSSRSWVVPAAIVIFYAVFSTGELNPEGLNNAAFNTLFLAVSGYILWEGRYYNELRDRTNWYDNQKLQKKIVKQKAELNYSQSRLVELEEFIKTLDLLATSDTGESPEMVRTMTEATTHLQAPLPKPEPQLVEIPQCPPNSLLCAALAGKKADAARIQRIAQRIRQPDYGLRDFFDDSVASFPELNLFFVGCASSSGRGAHVEYQRTIGALFAVYWILRLDLDGKHGFCFGVDDEWRTLPPTTQESKRMHFLQSANWSKFTELVSLSGCDAEHRIVALLCLTSFHDIMKMSDFCPIVQACHAPYYGYAAGDLVNDHDIALSYVLEHYPYVLPSFAMLTEPAQKAILFTQGRMQFNHGWFVQAEAPPGAMLSPLKQILYTARPGNLAFYFVHWLTDLAGAEGTPLGGAEKFVLKFPHKVLTAFLWSIPFLDQLATTKTETAVVEDYLKARWHDTFPDLSIPEGVDMVAKMRLAVMAQANASYCLAAFNDLTTLESEVLSEEMARTGVAGQMFQSVCVDGGPAFLVYYGPALLQRCRGFDECLLALRILVAVYTAGRALWPLYRTKDAENTVVTLNVSRLKEEGVNNIFGKKASETWPVWVLMRKGAKEAVCEMRSAGDINMLIEGGTSFRVVDFRRQRSSNDELLEKV